MKKRLGFALVEMLVVIGAISALSAIAYPSVDKGFEKGRESRDITAMHSADSLMTSAALTGRIIDGKPAKDYTGSTPLYFDGDGNLTSTPPAPYGKGTLKGAGEIWSCCDDYQYNPNGDYTNGYIYCWYDPATRVTHVHWSSDSTPGDSGSTPTTPPKYDDFPTRPTETEPETTEPTTPTIPDPKEDPTIIEILGTGHPWPEMVEEPSWSTELKPGFEPVRNGHRYVYNGTVYMSVNTFDSNTNYRYIKPDEWGWAFCKLTGRVLNSVDNRSVEPVPGQTYNIGDIIMPDKDGNLTGNVGIKPGDLYAVYELVDGKYVITDCFVAKVETTNAVAPTAENYNQSLWSRICFKTDCDICGIDPPEYGTADSASED